MSLILAMVIAAFFGGMVSAGIFSARTTLAEKDAIAGDTFRLLDKIDNVRAILTTAGEDEQLRLVLLDQRRKPRAKLAVNLKGDPYLFLWDAEGKARVRLGLKMETRIFSFWTRTRRRWSS